MISARTDAAAKHMLALIDKHVPDRAAFNEIAAAINEYRSACIDDLGTALRATLAERGGRS